MTVSCIDRQKVNTCIYKSCSSFHHIVCDTYCSTTEQSAFFIFCRVWIHNSFFDIFDCDKTFENAVFINQWQFFYFMFFEKQFCIIKRNARSCCNKVVFCHNFADWTVHIHFEAHIPVCDNTNQNFVFVYNWYTGNTIASHKSICFVYFMIRAQVKWVCNNTVFTSFYFINFCSLSFDRHIFVDDADTAFSGESDSHSGFCNSIHRCRHKWYIQCDFVAEFCNCGNICWHNL